ncbi:MAG: NAD(P)H-dependent oxidoreductase [Nannocystaceae bacterium]|nr:NAD(P)H-dependent oxidoreductase [Nannocystaceae bacterium]
MKILAFAASSSSTSLNAALVTHAGDRLQEILPAAEIQLLDLREYDMPVYSTDRETSDGIPEPAQRFFEKIGEADALLISYAEHNGSYTAAFKNTFDWASRIQAKVFQGKPMTVLSTSPGPRGGGNVLATALSAAPHFGAEVLSSLSVPSFHKVFDLESGTLTDAALTEALTAALGTLASRLAP